jgi:glucuronate isomerase
VLGIDQAVRGLARELYGAVADAPIISPHGHVSAEMLANNRPFADPAELFVRSDHYVTRLLHSSGIALDDLGLGGSTTPPREIWRTLCANWHLFAGTPVRYWLADSLARVFDLTLTPGTDTADELYDRLSEELARPTNCPREPLARFGVEVLATTDDPADSLEHHRRLAAVAELPTGCSQPCELGNLWQRVAGGLRRSYSGDTGLVRCRRSAAGLR